MPEERPMKLQLLPQRLSVTRFPPDEPIPEWAYGGSFFSVTRTDEELSIFCDSDRIPEDVSAVGGWRAFRVAGQLDLALPGIISQLAMPLAARQISIFSLSTHDTDYMLVSERQLDDAREILLRAGHEIEDVS